MLITQKPLEQSISRLDFRIETLIWVRNNLKQVQLEVGKTILK